MCNYDDCEHKEDILKELTRQRRFSHWTDKFGNHHLISDMTDSYLLNCLSYFNYKTVPHSRHIQLSAVFKEANRRGLKPPWPTIYSSDGVDADIIDTY